MEIKKCLSELVDSVAEQADNEIGYKTFKIHEAILAQTRSTTSGSSDDDWPARTPEKSPEKLDGSFNGGADMMDHQASFVGSFQYRNHWPPSECLILKSAHECISLTQLEIERGIGESERWQVCVKANESLIEWRSLDKPHKRANGLLFSQVLNCLVDERLVMWVLVPQIKTNSNLANVAARSDLNEQVEEEEKEERQQELETTLDDIAMALDETIDFDSNNNHSMHMGAIRHNCKQVSLEVLVWVCSSESVARELAATFKRHRQMEGILDSSWDEESSLDGHLISADRALRVKVEHQGVSVNKREEMDSGRVSSMRPVEVTNDPVSRIEDNRFTRLRAKQQVKSPRDSSQSSVPTTKSSSSRTDVRVKAKASPENVVNHHHQQQQQQHQVRQVGRLGSESKRAVETPVVASVCRQSLQTPIATTHEHARTNAPESERKGNKREPSIVESGRVGASLADPGDKRNKRIAADSTESSSSSLASYYRSVANRVISNSQSRIKSFKDEVVRLNSRMPASAAAASKRLSMSIQTGRSFARSSVGGQLDCGMSGSVRNLSSTDESALVSVEVGAATTPLAQTIGAPSHQRRNGDSGKLAEGPSNRSKFDQNTTPAIKPRTSIMKKKLQKDACDSNNNIDYGHNGTERAEKVDPLWLQMDVKRRVSNDEDEQFGFKDDALQPSQTLKPKSILKTSKSVPNVAYEEAERTHSKNNARKSEESCQFSDGKGSNLYKSNIYDNGERNALSSAEFKGSEGRLELVAQSKSNLDPGRSTYSMANESVAANRIEREDTLGEVEFEKSEENKRDLAFERIRQRASCYDISRLMSKQNVRIQLNKLKSGSASSISGKLRQRRPALLLDDNEANTSQEKLSRSVENDQDALKLALKSRKTSSGTDGTVRAKVSAEQLNSSAIEWSQARSGGSGSIAIASAQGGRRQQQQQQQQQRQHPGTSGAQRDDASMSRSAKRSEFDPRSLRKVPPMVCQREAGQHSSATEIEGQKHKIVVNVQARDRHEKPDEVKMGKQLPPPLSAGMNEDSSTEDESPGQVATSSLSKNGPFSLLRQSFNQKTISSMLKFSGRASLRVKAPAQTDGEAANKSSAVVIAEANLMAAKQLKQQAQKLKEQQKREQHQSNLDSTAVMLAAVQYNQQVQRQQQQQMLYQRYAIAARGQMFDAPSVQLQQHQLLYQSQQQQQQQHFAYISNLNSAHYVSMLPPTSMMPMGAMPPQPLVYVPPQMPIQHQPLQAQTESGIFRNSAPKGKSKLTQIPYQQAQVGQHLMPMAVNHHSSLNIVYAGPSSQIPRTQHQSSSSTYSSVQNYEAPQQQPVQYSLGASMRKTVKSILSNRSSSEDFAGTKENRDIKASSSAKASKLKSALKSSKANRDIVLNSEGSDGDGSSSDSTTMNSGCEPKSVLTKSDMAGLPKSVLKKTLSRQELSSESSDSSCSSAEVTDFHENHKTVGLVENFDYRHSMGVDSMISKYHSSSSTNRTLRKKSIGNTARKNVTFSTVTSIL
mgnify:CR=1 FL=1